MNDNIEYYKDFEGDIMKFYKRYADRTMINNEGLYVLYKVIDDDNWYEYIDGYEMCTNRPMKYWLRGSYKWSMSGPVNFSRLNGTLKEVSSKEVFMELL